MQLSISTKYTVSGILFGLAFPLAAWALEIVLSGLILSPGAIVQLHLDNPIHFIVDLAPVVLGVVFYFLGKKYEGSLKRNYFSSVLAQDRVTESAIGFNVGVSVLMVLILLALGTVSIYLQKTLFLKSQEQVGRSLSTILSNTEQAVLLELEEDLSQVLILAGTEHIVQSVQELFPLQDRPQKLISSPAQIRLRRWIVPILRTLGYQGYFIISPAGINLAASHDVNAGKTSIFLHHRGFLEKIWQGDTALSEPHHAKIPLPDSGGKLVKGLIMQLVGAPIKNAAGEIIAVLALGLDPNVGLSPLFRQGRFGDSGETYAFIKEGEIITQSRFQQQIEDYGIRRIDAVGVAHLEVRDPGVNLTRGEKTKSLLKHLPFTRMAKSALAGEAGQDLDGYRDYRGVQVIGSWLWSDRLNFGMATEIDVVEAYATANFNNRVIVISTFVLGLIFLGIAAIIIKFLSESKKAAQILIENEQTTRMLLNSTGEGIYGIDLEGKCIFANKTCLEMLGNQSEDELLSRNMHDLIHHTRNDGTPFPVEDCKIFKAFKEGKGSHVNDEVLWRKDGSSFSSEYRSFPIQMHGKVIGAVVSFTDISTQLESDVRQRAVLNTMIDGLVTIDDQGIIESFNPAAEQIFKYASKEVIGKNVSQLMPDPHRGQHHKYLERYQQTGEAHILGIAGIEIEGLRKDGSTLPLAISLSEMYIGEKHLFSAVIRDITEGKSADSQREQIALELVQLIDSANAPIFGINTRLQISEWNQAAAKLTGYSKDEVLDRLFIHEFIDDADKDAVEEIFNAALVGEETADFELNLKTKAHGIANVLFNTSTRRDMNGEITGVIGIGQDFTARKKSEAELRRSEALLSYSQKVAHMGSWELDLIDDRYTWSDEAMRILGFTTDTLPHGIKAFLEHVHAEDRDDLNASFQASLKDQTPYEATYRFNHCSLGIRWIHVLGGTTYDTHGSPLNIVGTLQDITDGRQKDAALQQAQKMEAVGQLTGGIAHDFNNLLSIISGNLRFLQQDIGQTSTEINELFEDATSAVEDGAELTKRLLGFSRNRSLYLETKNVNHTVEKFVRFLARTLGESIELDINLPDEDLFISVDPSQLENALLNLSLNARDAMPSGGTITIHVLRTRHAANLPDGEYVKIAVVDTGTGINEEDLQHVYEPFFTTKEVGKGSGLGLSMVYGFIQQSNGTCEITSTLGKGTTVSMFFPEVLEHRPREIDTTLKDDLHGTEVILVVEDEPRVRRVTLRDLKKLGYKTLEAENADMARAIIESGENIDLLFSDILMPGTMDGHMLAIWTEDKYPNIKVVLTSGYSKGKADVSRHKAQPFPMIRKPYSVDKLAKQIRTTLSER